MKKVKQLQRTGKGILGRIESEKLMMGWVGRDTSFEMIGWGCLLLLQQTRKGAALKTNKDESKHSKQNKRQ